MRSHHPVLALILVLSVLLAPSAAAAPADLEEPVQRHLEQVMDEKGVPGVAVALVPHEGPTRRWTVGEDGNGRAISPATPFLLGSVSKSFTAAVVHELVDDGRLRLGDPLGDLLPEHGIPDERADEITVAQLLTHTSGLTRADGLAHADRFDNAPGAIRRQAEHLTDVSLARSPGAGYEYSDLNYLLLGAVVEEKGDAPFSDQVAHLAEGTGLDLITTASSAESIPPGHRQVLGRPAAFDSGYDTSGTPYGYLGADLDGLAAWGRAQLGGERSPTGLVSMHSGHVETGSGDRYGHGWRVGTVDGERAVQHTGATPGYFAHVLVLPQRGLAVVVLANAYSEARAPSLAAVATDLARIEAGHDPVGASDDPVLGVAPFVLAGMAALGLVLALVLPGRRRRMHALALALAVLVLAAALLAPTLLGYSSEQLRLWAPDLGWGLLVTATTWALAGAVAGIGLVRDRARRGRSEARSAPSREGSPVGS